MEPDRRQFICDYYRRDQPLALLRQGGAEVAVGSAMAGHGTMMMAQGSKNYSEKKGYLGNSTPKNSDQINSKTLWKGKKGERIDVENPKNREGNIHYHDKSGK